MYIIYNMENKDFLKKKYNNLHKSPEVESAAQRTEKRTGEKVPQNPEKKIQNYLDRFVEFSLVLEKAEETENRKERKLREQRNLILKEQHAQKIEALKKVLYKELVIKSEDIPERVFELEQDIAEQGGHGRPEITDQFKKQKTEQIQADQKISLDKWVNYLSSSDNNIPIGQNIGPFSQ